LQSRRDLQCRLLQLSSQKLHHEFDNHHPDSRTNERNSWNKTISTNTSMNIKPGPVVHADANVIVDEDLSRGRASQGVGVAAVRDDLDIRAPQIAQMGVVLEIHRVVQQNA
jgi:hypothetical protein